MTASTAVAPDRRARKGDTNEWFGSGIVVGDVKHSTTAKGVAACSFWIHSQKDHGSPDRDPGRADARIKINVYGDAASPQVLAGLRVGAIVAVAGELMNRTFNGNLSIEVRARSIQVTTPAESTAADMGVLNARQDAQQDNGSRG